MVAQAARNTLVIVMPEPRTSPPMAARQLVAIPVWLWMDPAEWHAVSASASAGPVTATVTATPTKAVWEMGDGATVVCDGPGAPYSPGRTPPCSHTYRDPSTSRPGGAYTVRVTVTWSVTWTSNTGPAGTQDAIELTTSFPLVVSQAQAETD